MILERHRCRSRVWAGLLHVEQVESEKRDLATEDEPLRAMFNMNERSWASESDGETVTNYLTTSSLSGGRCNSVINVVSLW